MTMIKITSRRWLNASDVRSVYVEEDYTDADDDYFRFCVVVRTSRRELVLEYGSAGEALEAAEDLVGLINEARK